ncbi:MAG: DMT family transporter [Pseudomonadota bacterium]
MSLDVPLPAAPNTRMTAFEWLLVVTLSILWGGSYFFNGIAVRELPTFSVVVGRVVVAAVILWMIMRATGTPMPRERPVLLAFIGMGLLNNVIPFSLIVWGQGQIASGLASILNAATPIFTVLVAHALTADEKLSLRSACGVAMGFAGVAVLVGGDALLAAANSVYGQLACLGAALSYAFASVFGRRFARMSVPSLATATGQVTASSVMLVPLMLWVDRPWELPMPGGATWAALLGVAALSTALAYVLYFRILATAGATNLMLVTLLIPVSAVALGILVLGEVLAPRHVAGLAVIGCALLILDGRLLSLLHSRRRTS